MAEIRRELKRYEGLNHARYLTCSCYKRLPLFGNDAIKNAFVEHFSFVQQIMSFELYAWVIMPEHVHLLLRPAMSHTSVQYAERMLRDTSASAEKPPQTVTQVLRRLKSSFAKRVVARWRVLDAPILERITDSQRVQRFWQTGGGYDRNIFSEQELHEKINYIHQNPVRRGLVDSASDYDWSSVRFYEGRSYVGPTLTLIS